MSDNGILVESEQNVDDEDALLGVSIMFATAENEYLLDDILNDVSRLFHEPLNLLIITLFQTREDYLRLVKNRRLAEKKAKGKKRNDPPQHVLDDYASRREKIEKVDKSKKMSENAIHHPGTKKGQNPHTSY
ncbi:unnamed protein product [Arabis nemorensis]|uniref:Uncharacterized protein n=1 Tax=Arabis nemorensis TaxID=586526 RepID=A0A565ATJ7_9BRAS|nr:unnamed protein product [Arabis nemorensis]